MYPYLHIVLPSYGVFAFLGGLIVLFFSYLRIEKLGIHFSDFLKLYFVSVLGVLIGSKALSVLIQIVQLEEIPSHQKLLSTIIHSGFVFYGGLFGLLISVFIYANISKRYSKKLLEELIVPAIPLFHFFGRIGCFFAGCCYGISFATPISIGFLKFNRFPTQLVESAFELILFLAIMLFQKRKAFDLLKFYLLSYSVFRFFLEFLRGDSIRGKFINLSTSQWISLSIILYYLVKCILKRTNFSFKSTNCDSIDLKLY